MTPRRRRARRARGRQQSFCSWLLRRLQVRGKEREDHLVEALLADQLFGEERGQIVGRHLHGTIAEEGGRRRVLCRGRLCRGRDAGAAGQPRAGAAPEGVQDDPPGLAGGQGAAVLPAHLARIRDEEAAGRKAAANLAAGSRVSGWRAQRHASPRIRDAGVVSGRGRLSRSDGRMRGVAPPSPGSSRGAGATVARAQRRCKQRLGTAHRRRGIRPLCRDRYPGHDRRPGAADTRTACGRGSGHRCRSAPGRRLGDPVLSHLPGKNRAAARPWRADDSVRLPR